MAMAPSATATGARPGGDHDGDAAVGDRVEVDAFHAHARPGDDPQPGGPVQEGGVDRGVGPVDRPLRLPQVRVGRVRDEPAPAVEHVGDQAGIDDAEPDHQRQRLRHEPARVCAWVAERRCRDLGDLVPPVRRPPTRPPPR